VAEGGGLLNRTGTHEAVTKQAKTCDFLSISLNLNSVLCLPMCREASRSLHNLLHSLIPAVYEPYATCGLPPTKATHAPLAEDQVSVHLG
jgi:hypothetical protein